MHVDKLLRKNTKIIESILPDATVLEATQKLATCKIGILLVCDEDQKLVGVISERDLVQIVGLNGIGGLERTVEEAMTKDVTVCSPRDDLQDVMNAMAKGNFRHMPVMNDGVLQGMISTRDVLNFLSDDVSPDERSLFWSQIAWV